MRLIGSKPYKVTSVTKDVIAGKEVLTNGSFAADSDWSKEGAWTITGGKAVCTSNGNTNTIFQDVNAATMGSTLQLGKTYVLKFTISDYSEGGVQPRVGNVFAYTLFNSNGDKSIEITPTNITNNAVGLVAIGGSTTLKIANFTCKEKQPVTFQSSTSWTAPQTRDIEVLVVAGGGSGGHNPAPGQHGGGGGGGGIVHNKTYPVVAGWTYDVTVGAGGAGEQNDTPGNPSTFSRNSGGATIENAHTAIGGAEGGASGSYTGHPGTAKLGGSGGGGGGSGPSTYQQGGGTQSGGRVSQLPIGYGSIGQGYGSSGGESNGVNSPEPGGGGGGGAGGYGYPGHREPSHNKIIGQTNNWRSHPYSPWMTAPTAAWSLGSQQGGNGGDGKQFPSFKSVPYTPQPTATPHVSYGTDIYNFFNQPNYPGWHGVAPKNQGGYFSGGGGAGGVSNTTPASNNNTTQPRFGGGHRGGYNGVAASAMYNTGGGGGGSHHAADSGAGGSGFVGLVGEATTFQAPGVWDIRTIYKIKRRLHPLDNELPTLDEWQ